MTFAELVRSRRSIRVFEPRAVDVQPILKAANAAPSAGNLQAYEIVRVTSEETRRKLMRASLDQDSILQAPVVLVFFAAPGRSSVEYGERGADLYCVQDATISCTYAQLAAADLGLGSVWIGAFDDAAVRRALHAPRRLRPVAMLPIGHPAERARSTPRRRLSDLVHEERL